MFMSHRRWQGFTLIELQISILVGLIVLAGITTVVVTGVRSSAELVSAAKLNEEVGALMTIMSGDIRRAGYWGSAALETPNPFTNRDAANPPITDIGIFNSGTCIVYAYDRNSDGVVDDNEYLGFRLSNNDRVQMRTSGSTNENCSDGNWEAVTDPSVVVISDLRFSLVGTRCLNGKTGVSWVSSCSDTSAAGYVAPVAGDVLVETRQVVIGLGAHLASDSFVRVEVEDEVRVRNDRAFGI